MTARLEYLTGLAALAVAAIALSTLYLRILVRRKATQSEQERSAGRSWLPV